MMAIKRDLHTFISYPSRLHHFAQYLAEILLRCKILVWFDSKRVDAGDIITEELEKALTASGAIIVIVDEKGLTDWQKLEVDYAIRRRVKDKSFKIIPVLPPGCGIDCLEKYPFLESLKSIKFKKNDDGKASEKLLIALEGKKEKKDKRSRINEEIDKEERIGKKDLKIAAKMLSEGDIEEKFALALMMKIFDRMNERIEALANQLLSLKDDKPDTPTIPKMGGKK